jgi:hypothetical protein
LGGHTNGRGDEELEGKNSSGARAREARTANAKRKGKKPPPLRLSDFRPRGVLSLAHAPRALTAGKMLAHWQAGPTTTAAAA